MADVRETTRDILAATMTIPGADLPRAVARSLTPDCLWEVSAPVGALRGPE